MATSRSGFDGPGDENHSHSHTVQGLPSSVFIILVLLGLQNLGLKVMHLPLNRLIEIRFCQEYYEAHAPSVIPSLGDIPESLCKVDSIQQRLAWLFGTIETVHIIIGIYFVLIKSIPRYL